MPQVVETCSCPNGRAIIAMSTPCSSKDMAIVCRKVSVVTVFFRIEAQVVAALAA